MQPQLWTRFLDFKEWLLAHPNLTDKEADFLYKAESQLFQNFQDEIINQTLNRQTQLTGDLLDLSADISTVLTEGGAYWLSGYYNGIIETETEAGVITHMGVFFGIREVHTFVIGDIFKVDAPNSESLQGFNGFYRVLDSITRTKATSIGFATVDLINKINAGTWKRIADVNGNPI